MGPLSIKLPIFAVSSSKPLTPPPPSQSPHLNVRFSFVPSISSRISHRAAAVVGSLRASATPARDRVIDFGKYKGRMLGSLPSAYLKWVSMNLRAGDTEEWARLADRVLADPVYRDRLEWEAAENILSGNAAAAAAASGGSALLEISERFGWDNEDKSGWSKVDFGLLGTSKGARIPRAAAREGSLKKEGEERRNESGGGGRRGERRERVRRLREKATSAGTTREDVESSSPASGGGAAGSPFPGRESLLRKALNRQRF
ncbi:uncharacterized protein LOC130989548 [Salvia miltiorrhiza]|uniref:uncharacterized protein LOC130989548 n=1 Tax=Salvia miltiorrhiza TaxID=226208 RepID=UPI0025ABD2DE|nr:uncharacterized protein LOC130989548 [Salvia miltiorrhiza]